MKYALSKQIRDNPALRRSFMALAKSVFGLSFEGWYQGGYWGGRYLPYSLTDGEAVVANASVNLIDTVWQDAPKRFVQIGTVMTAPSHRGRGLSRRLLEEILSDWAAKSDGIYLYANDTVLDFYPRFGFEQALEYQHTLSVSARGGSFRKLRMELSEDRELLERRYQSSNPFCALPSNGNFGLLMFYCGGPMKDCVYYSEELGLACIAEYTGSTLHCYDLFGESRCSLWEALCAFALPETQQALLGFSPKDGTASARALIGGEDTLFVLKGKENPFRDQKLRFPALSHA